MAPYGVTANCIMPSAATRLAKIGWRLDRNRARLDVDFDPTDPVHVAEMVCYLASPAAGWLSGQCFQVRGGIVEHVRTFAVDHTIERADRGWTAGELAGELPRMFGAGARRADPPPPDWQAEYQARNAPGSSTPT
jgi:3-oxoacyl-[acyl-carrier protein] reductase